MGSRPAGFRRSKSAAPSSNASRRSTRHSTPSISSPPIARSPAPGRLIAGARRVIPRVRSQACQSRSRTISACAGCGRPRRPGSWTVLFRPTTPRLCSGWRQQAPSSSARPTVTSSPWDRPTRIPRTTLCGIRGRPIAHLAARAAARPRPLPRDARRWRSALTPAVRSASRRRSAASWA